MKKNLKTLTAVAVVALIAASCGNSKQMNRSSKGKKKAPSSTPTCLTDCAPDFSRNGSGLGVEGPGQIPSKSEPGKYEPGKYEPSKYEPSKYEPVTYEPTVPTKSSTPVPSEPVVVKEPVKPAVNACLNPANYSINIAGYNFAMTRYTTKFYATVGSTGIYGNFATILDGKLVSINNSFSYYVKDGKLVNSGRSTMASALVTVDGTEKPFAVIEHDPARIYSIAGREYDAAYNLDLKGACLARFGSYSGGYPVLVLP